ncbi:NAD(P)/FAD-dependent oxidoreductase [Acidipila sp. EB88]|uniref:protoporphyrinogen/coproporphyrinogen oxidase n=1 Tax=Acidipila sp. EB88 TaxID=2305226 RepID=UPI0013152939|nr:FAD-dependent oxidoreductase [Acidipila sp. EB88]
MRSVRVLIAGAGPCGLGAALELLDAEPGGTADFLLVDPGSTPGGWAQSRTTAQGFTFDFGGHVLFPHKHYARFAELLRGLPLEWASSVPERGVDVDGCFLPYPAQRNLHRLPLHRLVRAIASVLLHRFRTRGTGGAQAEEQAHVRGAADGNMGRYLQTRFGHYVTKLLMQPLNQKQWAHQPAQLTDVWARHRSGSTVRNVADMDMGRMLRNLLAGTDDLGWTPETKVTYPAKGGSGAIWSAIARAIPDENIQLGTHIVSISLEDKTALLSTGETVQWEQLISTMPLDMLLRSIPERKEFRAKADQLVKARSRLFGFGVRGSMPHAYAGLHSCQVTSAEMPFWRVNFPMTVAEGNGPEGCYSVLCEVSEPGSVPARSAEALRAEVQQSLVRMGLLGKANTEVISTWEYTIEHGYPVPFLGRDTLLSEVQPLLESAGVYSRGRFGAWRYEISNQDHAYMQGVEVVRRILYRIPEETYGNAGAVNEAVAEQKVMKNFATAVRESVKSPVRVSAG